jgi:maltose alpha-D-glucosyltransferase/alpha-amylase
MSNQDSLWYQDAIFYEVNIRAFFDSNGDGCGDFAGLQQKLEYLTTLGIDCIWILPHYPSPLQDDGYDVSDYYGIHQDLGTLEDFKHFIHAAHGVGLKVITDLVLNHTSDQHAWFKQARKSKTSPFRDYYVWSDSAEVYPEARIIFLDSETSNWAWDEQTGQYYWHRFYSHQPDLNYKNPKVQEEMLQVVQFWLELGLDGFRADAVPYLFEQEGTSCENLPETHNFLKKLRRFMDENYPGTVILSEANQWPEDVRPYFGDGDEVQMNFHFPLMPRIFMALKLGDIKPVREILIKTPEIPNNCQWCTFLRNHDELTLEMVSAEERDWMWRVYAPDPRMRLNLGIRRRLAPLLDNDHENILMANSLLLTLPGSPVIYYGDEIGMGDNIDLMDRDGVRTPMQWDDTHNAGFSGASSEMLYTPVINDQQFGFEVINVKRQIGDPTSLFNHLKEMIAKRKRFQAFGKGTLQWAETGGNHALAAFWRTYEHEKLLVIHNLIAENQSVDLIDLTGFTGLPQTIFPRLDLDDTRLFLKPHGFIWLDYSNM